GHRGRRVGLDEGDRIVRDQITRRLHDFTGVEIDDVNAVVGVDVAILIVTLDRVDGDVSGDLGANGQVAVEIDDVDRVFTGIANRRVGNRGFAADHSARPATDNGAHGATKEEADRATSGAADGRAGDSITGLGRLS